MRIACLRRSPSLRQLAFHATTRRRTLRVLAGLLAAMPVGAIGAQAAQQRPGLAPDRVVRIDRVLQGFVDRNELAGAVALVLRDGKVVYERAVGWADKESDRKMTTDAIFRIASQSKAITSVSVLLLVEEGAIGLSDPVSKFIPSFKNPSVMGADGKVVPAKRAITVQDLLTHTAGISYGTDSLVEELYRAKGMGPAAGYGWYTADKDEPICSTMERLGTLPFVAQPGESFVYGYNTDILGCVVERASGMPLDAFIRTRITKPLRMTDTDFFLAPEKRARLATVYRSAAGAVERAPDGARGQGSYVDGPRASFSGGAGLLSTARDYARFLQMTLNGGELDGVRIMAPHTVQLMTTNQIGTLLSNNGRGFGLGFETIDRYGVAGMRSVGSYGWGGAYGTWYAVDPKERLVLVLMLQQIPNSAPVSDRFSTAVYQAITR